MESVPRDLLWNRGWEGVLSAAHGAGGHAAAEVARRCSEFALGRTARVWAQVGPVEAPVVEWLRDSGRASSSEEQRALVEMVPRAGHLAAVRHPARTARALMVRQAYARAFCAVLESETGASTEIRIAADPRPSRPAVAEVAAEPAPGG